MATERRYELTGKLFRDTIPERCRIYVAGGLECFDRETGHSFAINPERITQFTDNGARKVIKFVQFPDNTVEILSCDIFTEGVYNKQMLINDL